MILGSETSRDPTGIFIDKDIFLAVEECVLAEKPFNEFGTHIEAMLRRIEATRKGWRRLISSDVSVTNLDGNIIRLDAKGLNMLIAELTLKRFISYYKVSYQFSAIKSKEEGAEINLQNVRLKPALIFCPRSNRIPTCIICLRKAERAEGTDYIIKCREGNELHFHSRYFFPKIPFLETLFEGPFKEAAESKKYHETNFSFRALLLLRRYMYVGHIGETLSIEQLSELLVIAEYWLIEELKSYCLEKLS